ncbi:MAG: V-type ATPase subunit [Synergistaceae bacterium]|jgi:V/A-type H+-transporting ATPase subunit C|nr:V-type ATPase subunit [Synergistaceae bacterium]
MTAGSGARVAQSTKARVRRASLFQSNDFRLFLEQRSAGEVAVQLGNTAYAPILKDFVLEDMRRTELEFLLNVSILAEGVTFRHYAGLRDKRLLDLWLESFDIGLLKNHLRTKLGTGKWDEHLSPDRILDLVSDFRLTLVDQNKLFKADTLKDVVAAVKNESLRAAIMEAIPSGRENMDLAAGGSDFQDIVFAVGMILDRNYFDGLYTAVANLGGDEGRMLRMLVGTRVDLMNLDWIYRARRFFGMSPEASLTLIMKNRYRANFEFLRKAAFAAPHSLAATLEGTPYARVFDVDGVAPALKEVVLGSNIYRLLFAAAERVFLAGALGFQNVAAYLMLKELEVRDLVAVVEMVRYGFDRRKASQVLVKPI